MALTSKAQTFVVELLSEIFLECLPDDGLALSRQNEAPLNVSEVSRHWRYVSLSTHRLWAGIYLDRPISEYKQESNLQILRMFLQRSGSARFNFKMNCFKTIPKDDPLYLISTRFVDSHWLSVEAMLEELADHAGRIKSFALSTRDWNCDDALRFLRRGALPALDSLSLELERGLGNGIIRLDGQFWRSISTLKSLEIRRGLQYNVDFDGAAMCPVLQTLVLDSTGMGENEVLRILDICPALKTLRFSPAFYPRAIVNPTDDTMRKAFPSIQCLHIVDRDTCSYSIGVLLDIVKFPDLRRLIVQEYELLTTTVEKLLLASRPPLEELYVTSMFATRDDTLRRLFVLLPYIKKLRVPLMRITLQALTLSNPQGEYNCPLLEEITFDIYEMTFEKSVQTWTAAEDMIRSRWRSSKGRLPGAARLNEIAKNNANCLRKIILPGIKEEHWKRHQLYRCIKDCQREGLIISFREEDPMLST